jgi:membrane-associated protein
MDYLKSLIDLFLHLDKHLENVVPIYGTWIYLLLFLIIFCETGLVVTPILPGDSLLFAVGAVAAKPSMGLNVGVCFIIISAAAFLGDTTNYWLGYYFGPKVFSKEKSRIFNKQYLIRTQKFYDKYGGKTIIMARFVPIVRTFAPFVAGIGKMGYLRFISYSIFGTLLWTSLCLFGGYFFGSIPIVKNNFSIAILAVVFISLLPAIIEFLRHRYRADKSVAENSVSNSQSA